MEARYAKGRTVRSRETAVPVPAIPREHLEAYSAGRLTRRELEGIVAHPVGFGALLSQLRDQDLTLPRIPADPANVRFLVDLLSRSDVGREP